MNITTITLLVVFGYLFQCSPIFLAWSQIYNNENTSVIPISQNIKFLITFVFLFVPLIIAIIRWVKKSKLRGGLGFVIGGASWIIFYKAYEGSDDLGMILGIIIWLISMAILLGRSKKKSYAWKRQSNIRKPFPKNVRDSVLENQKNRCAICNTKIYPPLIHFDHINGNRSNNHISNCQALCPNCHTLKTDEDRKNL